MWVRWPEFSFAFAGPAAPAALADVSAAAYAGLQEHVRHCWPCDDAGVPLDSVSMTDLIAALKAALVEVFPALPAPAAVPRQLTKDLFTAVVKGQPGFAPFLKFVKKLDKKSFFGLLDA